MKLKTAFGPSDNAAVRSARNEDPITGEPGSHPGGVAFGATIGAAAIGTAGGSLAGPIGATVGAVVGGIVGGYAGKIIAEDVDPTIEAEFWRETYPSRPYATDGYSYDDFEPAYQTGWELHFDGTEAIPWTEREAEARSRWEQRILKERKHESETVGLTGMTWEEARMATQDAYERILEKRRRDEASRKP